MISASVTCVRSLCKYPLFIQLTVVLFHVRAIIVISSVRLSQNRLALDWKIYLKDTLFEVLTQFIKVSRILCIDSFLLDMYYLCWLLGSICFLAWAAQCLLAWLLNYDRCVVHNKKEGKQVTHLQLIF